MITYPNVSSHSVTWNNTWLTDARESWKRRKVRAVAQAPTQPSLSSVRHGLLLGLHTETHRGVCTPENLGSRSLTSSTAFGKSPIHTRTQPSHRWSADENIYRLPWKAVVAGRRRVRWWEVTNDTGLSFEVRQTSFRSQPGHWLPLCPSLISEPHQASVSSGANDNNDHCGCV